ncbi:MAG: alpha/beta fold hydrolase [Elusimicrobiota bacterium]
MLLGSVALLLAGAFLAFCWYGSNLVLHPPKMLAMEVFPERFGLAYDKVCFRAKDGVEIKGWLIPAREPSGGSLLLCHGWGDNKGDLLERLHFLSRRFNLFLFDSRGHGESGRGLCTLGCLESMDFDAALRFLKDSKPDWAARLGLCGLSMGAAMAVRGMAEHDGAFRCAVLEAPFESIHDVVARFTWSHYRLPCFPTTGCVMALLRWRLGADPEPYSPVYHVRRLPPIPLLFIAGERDGLMPEAVVRRLSEAAPGPKELWVVPEATHGHCQDAAGAEYARRVEAFFEKHL